MFSGPKARYPSSASRKNRQPPLPSGLHPLIPPKTRMSQVTPTAQRRSYGFLTRNFLTIPITSATIIPPASLRSDYLIGIRRNADRLPSGTLIDFPRIRSFLQTFPRNINSARPIISRGLCDLPVDFMHE